MRATGTDSVGRLNEPKERKMKPYPLVLVAVLASLLVVAAMPASFAQDLDAAFKAVANYKFGESREPLTVVADAVRDSQADPAQRQALVGRLLALLKSDDVTNEGKDFACRQLSIAGGEEAVPALAALLAKEDMSNMARYALERIPGDAAENALLNALGKTSGLVRIGIVNSLGERRQSAAVGALAGLAKNKDAATAESAWAALAKIANADAVKALAAAKKSPSDSAHPKWAEAWLTAADNVAKSDKPAAAKMFAQLLKAGEPGQIRVAAFIGKVNATGADALPEVVAALKGDSLPMRRAAAIFVRNIDAPTATATFAGLVGDLDPDGQVLLLAALSDRGDAAAMPAATKAAETPDLAVRKAAYAAMAKLGDASVIPVLLKAAATADREEQLAARIALDTLKGRDIDPALANSMSNVDEAQQVEIARSLAARGAASTTSVLLWAAGNGAEDVKKESFKALGELASAAELEAVVALLVTTGSDTARREAEKAVASIAKNVDEGSRADAVLAAIDSTKDKDALASLYATLSLIGEEKGLAPLRASAKKSRSDLYDAAVRALAAWPTDAALPDVLDIAQKTKDETHRVLALRGLLRMLELKKNRSAEDSLAYLTGAMKAAEGENEMKMVIGGLANVGAPKALKLVQPFMKEENLKLEATLAAQKIFKNMCKASANLNSGEARMAIDSDNNSRWHTGEDQKPGQWFAVDMGDAYTLSSITLDSGKTPQDYPRGYQVYVSNDNQNWGSPVAEGKGTDRVLKIDLPQAKGRYVKIVQTGSVPQYNWTIYEITFDFK